MRTTRLLAAAAIAALAIVAAGCGGGSSETTTTTAASASDWASQFCGAFATWDQAVKDATSQLTSSPSKDSLQKAASDIDTATQQLVTELKGLGAPDTQSGQDIKNSVDSLATTVQTQTDTIKTSVDQASGLSGYITAGKDAVTSLGKMNDALQSTLTTIENADAQGELKSALESSPDCKNLTK